MENITKKCIKNTIVKRHSLKNGRSWRAPLIYWLIRGSMNHFIFHCRGKLTLWIYCRVRIERIKIHPSNNGCPMPMECLEEDWPAPWNVWSRVRVAAHRPALWVFGAESSGCSLTCSMECLEQSQSGCSPTCFMSVWSRVKWLLADLLHGVFGAESEWLLEQVVAADVEQSGQEWVYVTATASPHVLADILRQKGGGGG